MTAIQCQVGGAAFLPHISVTIIPAAHITPGVLPLFGRNAEPPKKTQRTKG